MDVGKNIKEARKAKGLTQKQLAEIIGVAEITIAQYERNKREPSLSMLHLIADALGVSMSYLTGVYEVRIPSSDIGQEKSAIIRALEAQDCIDELKTRLEAERNQAKKDAYQKKIDEITADMKNDYPALREEMNKLSGAFEGLLDIVSGHSEAVAQTFAGALSLFAGKLTELQQQSVIEYARFLNSQNKPNNE